MKKILIAGLFSLAFTGAAKAAASHYTVNASSYPITEGNTISADIPGSIAIEQIFISASSTTTPQAVSIYSDCESTTTATLVWKGYLAVAGVTEAPIIKLEFPHNLPMYITDICFRKSDANSNVQFFVYYR